MKILLISLLLFSIPNYAFTNNISVKDIDGITLDEIGLLNSGDDGSLGFDLWQNGNKELIEILFSKLPENAKSPSIKNILNRVLLTSAKPPKGETDFAPLINLRLQKLTFINQNEEAQQLFNKIPENMIGEDLQQIYTVSLFTSNKISQACGLVKKNLGSYNSDFWRKSLLFCQAFNGKVNEVEFSLNLFKEDGIKISTKFQSLLKNTKWKYDTDQKWLKILRDEILKEPEISISKPVLSQDIGLDIISKWNESDLADVNLINNIIKHYAILDATGHNIEESEWINIFIYLVSRQIDPPDIIITKLLDKFANADRRGETVLLSLYSIGNKEINELETDIFFKIIESLTKIGLQQEARMVAAEVTLKN